MDEIEKHLSKNFAITFFGVSKRMNESRFHINKIKNLITIFVFFSQYHKYCFCLFKTKNLFFFLCLIKKKQIVQTICFIFVIDPICQHHLNIDDIDE